MKHFSISFFLARIAIGMSMFGHGLVRIPKLTQFAAGMSEKFQKSILPDFLVAPFGYILPVAEFIIGLLILLGLFTRLSLIAGALVMVTLIFGTSMIEDWGAIPSQLIHTAFFCILLDQTEKAKTYSLDSAFEK
ncbi:DoxX family membrane protein [Dyadobacter helix]|nr:DoxX family membrane protein [Dyadobacter sp. CECT 9275]